MISPNWARVLTSCTHAGNDFSFSYNSILLLRMCCPAERHSPVPEVYHAAYTVMFLVWQTNKLNPLHNRRLIMHVARYYPPQMSRDQRKCLSGSGGVSGSLCFLREDLVLRLAVMSSLCSSHNLHELSPQHSGDTHESGFIKTITLKHLTKCG